MNGSHLNPTIDQTPASSLMIVTYITQAMRVLLVGGGGGAGLPIPGLLARDGGGGGGLLDPPNGVCEPVL